MQSSLRSGCSPDSLEVPGDAQKSGGLERNERWSKYVYNTPAVHGPAT